MSSNSQQFADLYDKLKSLAERQLRSSANLPIGADTLLHEAYLQMSARDAEFPDQDRFIGYAARVMRGLIIDLVREKRALKHGAGFHITQLPTEVGLSQDPEVLAEPLARLSEALDQLATRDERLAEVVDLKYFCGYTFEDIAAMRGGSKRTVLRDWEKARLLLFRQLKDLPDFPADLIDEGSSASRPQTPQSPKA